MAVSYKLLSGNKAVVFSRVCILNVPRSFYLVFIALGRNLWPLTCSKSASFIFRSGLLIGSGRVEIFLKPELLWKFLWRIIKILMWFKIEFYVVTSVRFRFQSFKTHKTVTKFSLKTFVNISDIPLSFLLWLYIFPTSASKHPGRGKHAVCSSSTGEPEHQSGVQGWRLPCAQNHVAQGRWTAHLCGQEEER